MAEGRILTRSASLLRTAVLGVRVLLSLLSRRVVITRQLIVRNVDDGIVLALKRRASRHGRSAEAERREILRTALLGDFERASFKRALASMPDIGADDDFAAVRDLPQNVE